MTTNRSSDTRTTRRSRPGELRTVVHYEQIEMHLGDDGLHYKNDLDRSVQLARDYLDRRLRARLSHERYAIVLDIDETAISNWEYFKTEWPQFTMEKFSRWASSLNASPIRPTLELFEYVKSQDVAVFFISLRSESYRTLTEQLLEKVGYRGWQELKLQPHLNPEAPSGSDSSRQESDAGGYKSGERRKIMEAGYLIIANIGDQQSDLSGGYAEEHFKLPNPFYSVL